MLRRIDCVLAPTKAAVRTELALRISQGMPFDAFLRKKVYLRRGLRLPTITVAGYLGPELNIGKAAHSPPDDGIARGTEVHQLNE